MENDDVPGKRHILAVLFCLYLFQRKENSMIKITTSDRDLGIEIDAAVVINYAYSSYYRTTSTANSSTRTNSSLDYNTHFTGQFSRHSTLL